MPLTVRPKGTEPGRNDPCPCKSGLKFKHCHGDKLKQAICNRLVNEKMVELITMEKKKRGLISYNYECGNCGHGFDTPKHGQVSDLPLCPKCENTDILENPQNEEQKS